MTFRAIAAAVSLLTATGCWGDTIVGITSTADAIVVGSISSRVESPTEVSFVISVDRTLKGTVPLAVPVNHKWARKGLIVTLGPVPTSGSDTVVAPMYGIWALRKIDSSNWDVLTLRGPDGMMPSLVWPATKTLPASYLYSPAAHTTDILALELGAGVESGAGFPKTFLDAASSLDGPVVRMVLANFLNSNTVEFQATGLAGLLARNDDSGVGELVKLWSAIAAAPAESTIELVTATLKNAFRGTSANSVQQLSALAGAGGTSTDLKAAIVTALSSVHTREALPFLASLLTSPNETERLRGIFGLSSFANGCVPQSPDNMKSLAFLTLPPSAPYQTAETRANFAFLQAPADAAQEQKLVAFWSNWWASHPELH